VLDMAVVHGLLWVIAVAASIWILVPPVMYALGFTRIHTEVDEDPARAEPRGDDLTYERWFKQLQALGYRPIGRSVEKVRFFTPVHWRWRSLGSRWMVSPDRTTFVSFYRVVSNSPLRFSAETIFEGGGALGTVSTDSRLDFDPGGNFRRIELGASIEPADLVEKHQEYVEWFCRERRLTVKRGAFREVVAETTELARRVLPKTGIRGLYAIVAIFLLPAWGALRIQQHEHAPLWFHPAVGICFAAWLFATARWLVLPSRTRLVVRLVVVAILVSVPIQLAKYGLLHSAAIRHDPAATHDAEPPR
jgi:hypothetical protein